MCLKSGTHSVWGGGAVRSHSEGSKKATRVLGQRCHETDKLLENGGGECPHFCQRMGLLRPSPTKAAVCICRHRLNRAWWSTAQSHVLLLTLFSITLSFPGLYQSLSPSAAYVLATGIIPVFLEEFRIGAGRAERSEGDVEPPCTKASLLPGTSVPLGTGCQHSK